MLYYALLAQMLQHLLINNMHCYRYYNVIVIIMYQWCGVLGTQGL